MPLRLVTSSSSSLAGSGLLSLRHSVGHCGALRLSQRIVCQGQSRPGHRRAKQPAPARQFRPPGDTVTDPAPALGFPRQATATGDLSLCGICTPAIVESEAVTWHPPPSLRLAAGLQVPVTVIMIWAQAPGRRGGGTKSRRSGPPGCGTSRQAAAGWWPRRSTFTNLSLSRPERASMGRMTYSTALGACRAVATAPAYRGGLVVRRRRWTRPTSLSAGQADSDNGVTCNGSDLLIHPAVPTSRHVTSPESLRNRAVSGAEVRRRILDQCSADTALNVTLQA